jgi:hypothetical protein
VADAVAVPVRPLGAVWDWDLQPPAGVVLAGLAAGPGGGEPRGVPEPLAWDGAPVLPGLTPRWLGEGGGFAAGGMADFVPPGPVLAGLAGDRWDAGLASVPDDELAGLMIAFRRLSSWATAGELAAVAELDRRRQAQVAAGADPRLAEHVADELAMVLTLTSWAAGALLDRAVGLSRLPQTMAALRAGEIDVPKALVILAEAGCLDSAHAAAVERAVIGKAPGWTAGQLRAAARRAVLAADPGAARERKEQAAKRARVERWAEPDGTAALAGRDLPPAAVLAADAHISGWARRLKAAGVAGSLDGLRAQVYLALLRGQPPQTLLPAGPAVAGEGKPAAASGEPAGGGSVRLAPVRGSVNLTVPLATWLGWSASPGEVAGYGPLDATDCRALATVLAADSGTRWCVTITGPDGRAVGHGCAKAGPGGAPSLPRPGEPCEQRPGSRPGAAPGPPRPAPGPPRPAPGPPRPAPGPPRPAPSPPRPPPQASAWLAGITLAWLESGQCAHQRETPSYRPSDLLRHLVQIRQVTCTAPGCRCPATSADFEHTIPYARGGRTCECNGGPCCRRHHRAKQATGWWLEQPGPGVFTWTLPSGRRYTTRPAQYPD